MDSSVSRATSSSNNKLVYEPITRKNIAERQQEVEAALHLKPNQLNCLTKQKETIHELDIKLDELIDSFELLINSANKYIDDTEHTDEKDARIIAFIREKIGAARKELYNSFNAKLFDEHLNQSLDQYKTILDKLLNQFFDDENAGNSSLALLSIKKKIPEHIQQAAKFAFSTHRQRIKKNVTGYNNIFAGFARATATSPNDIKIELAKISVLGDSASAPPSFKSGAAHPPQNEEYDYSKLTLQDWINCINTLIDACDANVLPDLVNGIVTNLLALNSGTEKNYINHANFVLHDDGNHLKFSDELIALEASQADFNNRILNLLRVSVSEQEKIIDEFEKLNDPLELIKTLRARLSTLNDEVTEFKARLAAEAAAAKVAVKSVAAIAPEAAPRPQPAATVVPVVAQDPPLITPSSTNAAVAAPPPDPGNGANVAVLIRIPQIKPRFWEHPNFNKILLITAIALAAAVIIAGVVASVVFSSGLGVFAVAALLPVIAGAATLVFALANTKASAPPSPAKQSRFQGSTSKVLNIPPPGAVRQPPVTAALVPAAENKDAITDKVDTQSPPASSENLRRSLK